MQTPMGNSTAIHPYPVGIEQDFFASTFSLRIRYNFYYQNGVFSVTASENVFTTGIALDDNYAKACLADLDGDGNRELVLGMWNNRGIATASLSDSTNSSRILYSDFHGESITAIESADFDLDGRDELVFFDRAGNLYIGGTDLSGKFEITPPLLVDYDLRNVFEIKTADFDGNGYPDFLYGDNTNSEIILMANENGSDFTRHVVIPDFSLQLAKVIDYDNDGLLDILIQPYPNPNGNNSAYIFKNQGNLQFTKTTYWPPGSLGKSPEEGPLNNTLVLRELNELRLVEITPNGFQILGSVEVSPYPIEYALLDYNRDSLPDIYYNRYPGKAGYICLNNGDGTFVKDAVLVPHIEMNHVFDLEKDGIPEFLAISRRDWMWGTTAPEVVVSAVHEPSIKYDLSLWPSPTRELLRVQAFGEEPIESVDIYSFSGTLCKRIQRPMSDLNIPVGDLAPGAYILVARFSKGAERFGRFVKME
ncbi:MAG: T9SS type A sorting domain-containing protein [Lewinellaceae bacterium]|nr:T9SS type A sorting domain-containing protein [Lewinellaceae bacterium]